MLRLGSPRQARGLSLSKAAQVLDFGLPERMKRKANRLAARKDVVALGRVAVSEYSKQCARAKRREYHKCVRKPVRKAFIPWPLAACLPLPFCSLRFAYPLKRSSQQRLLG